MKKINIHKGLVLTNLVLAPFAWSDSSGFYLGAGVNLSQFKTKINIDGQNGADSGSININKKEGVLSARLLGGYHADLDENWFTTIEAFAAPRDLSKKINGITVLDQDGDPTQEDVELKLERRYTVGANLKVGRYLNENTAVFASLSAMGSQFKVHYREDPNETEDKSFVPGIAPGVGVCHHISDKIFMTASYSYEIYKDLKTKNLTPAAGDSFRAKFENRFHSFMISFCNKF